MPDLGLVLQMADELVLPGQSPDEPSAVRRGVFLWSPEPHVREVHLGHRVVDGVHETLHEPVHLHVLEVLVGDFEGVVHEDVRCIK